MMKKATLKLLFAVVNFIAFDCSLVLAGDYNYGGFGEWSDNNTNNNQETSLIGFISPPEMSDSDDTFPSETSDSLDSSLMEMSSPGDFSSETGSYKQWYGETPVRHTWSNSESFTVNNVILAAASDPAVHTVCEQVPFLQGRLCPLFTKDSSIADVALHMVDGSWRVIEVKNYSVNNFGSLVSVLNSQLAKYEENLPDGTPVTILIDLRGQTITEDKVRSFCSHVRINSENIIFFGSNVVKPLADLL